MTMRFIAHIAYQNNDFRNTIMFYLLQICIKYINVLNIFILLFTDLVRYNRNLSIWMCVLLLNMVIPHKLVH